MTENRDPEDMPAPDTEPAAPPPLAPYVNAAADPQPASTPPPIAPPIAPPAVTWAAPPAAAPAVGQRTVLAALAGVLLVIGGILGGLAGLAVALIGGTFAASLGDLITVPGLSGGDAGAVFGGVVAFVGAIIVIYSVVYLIAGIGVLRNRNWGRIMGLTVGILSGLIWLGTVTSPAQPDVQQSIVGSLIALAVHVYIVVALLLFWRSSPSAA